VTYYPPGNGQTSSEELARYSLARAEQEARHRDGLARARALSGSRAARQALGERMAAVTPGNNADDRLNGGRGGHARPPVVATPTGVGLYLPTYPPSY